MLRYSMCENDYLTKQAYYSQRDDYLTLEGLFTVILYTKVEKGADNKIKYSFVTNNDGQFPAKSPIGMFESLQIPNDLGLVSKSIDIYNNGE